MFTRSRLPQRAVRARAIRRPGNSSRLEGLHVAERRCIHQRGRCPDAYSRAVTSVVNRIGSAVVSSVVLSRRGAARQEHALGLGRRQVTTSSRTRMGSSTASAFASRRSMSAVTRRSSSVPILRRTWPSCAPVARSHTPSSASRRSSAWGSSSSPSATRSASRRRCPRASSRRSAAPCAGTVCGIPAPRADRWSICMGASSASTPPSSSVRRASFSLSSEPARRVAGELLSRGKVIRSWLGRSTPTRPIDPRLRHLLELLATSGCEVSAVEPGGPAAQAGFLPGDVLVALDGERFAGIDEVQHVLAG